ncbi:MAG: LytTR family DNA-binding domain-containing protein [Flavobacterium sp.]|jgi:two-component system LytT family response regulator|uniref:LytR/AlgR family response regulator transcription factor n=1 Tax=Flavobacterium sp. TaxID=239 RepID=UPI000DB65779|nr:LytTR family DNA-binding domain-containing protein [Flavobacterium sp.]MCZ8089911.1 LytTR family DNA-binding domain-containing protein [Flavobacterium sp.]MCZ8332149.1 LytTR family DNA-binding domain-containing protein [Flavobacterium sp.]PZO28543.1 MAG: DNA-binding response regulator [Flavobacteriaceae bacterium]
MKKIKCIILDDEPLAVDLLKSYADKQLQLEVVLATTDVFEVIDYLQKQTVDLIFIDIQMPELSGIQLMQMFNKDNYFVVTTAYADYALESYDYRVVDYLLKPISFDKFHKSVQKFTDFVTLETHNHLFVKVDGRQVKINPKDIIFIEGLSDYIRIHLPNERLIVLDNLKDFINKLPSKEFMRIHKSYIIQLDKIKSIDGNMIYHDLGSTPIGETYKNEVKKWIGNKE